MPREKLFNTDEALDKAMHLFWRKGYNGTSINDLVEETGLSRSSLYATFIDKHQLYLAALAQYQSRENKKLMIELEKQTSALKKIEVIFRSKLSNAKEDLGKGCFMINTATEMSNQNKELARIASKDFSGMEELLISIIKEGQANGEINKKQKPKILANYLFSSYLGLRIFEQANPDKSKLDDIIKVTLGTLN